MEEAHLKLSSLVWDLLGARARRLLQALAEGETNPMAVATWTEERWRATPEPWWDARGACTNRKPVYRRLLKMALEQLPFLEQPIGQLDQEMARCSASTRMQSSGWRRCRAGEWIRRSRSWLKSVPPQRPSPRRNVSPAGWVPAPARKRARA